MKEDEDEDEAVIERKIPREIFDSSIYNDEFEEWCIVFTLKGRYFFVKYPEKISTWVPSDKLLEILIAFPKETLNFLFDPYYTGTLLPSSSSSSRQQKRLKETVDVFKEFLLENAPIFDPFAPWESIKELLIKNKDESMFIEITEREAKQIFDSMCPQLAQIKRDKKEEEKTEALIKWKEYLLKLSKKHLPPTWNLMLRQIRLDNTISFTLKILSEKDMKKDYLMIPIRK